MRLPAIGATILLALGAPLVGAEEPQGRHWAYQPISSPVPPARAQKDEWARNSIDHFILQRLNEADLRPSHEADRTTLIRRVTLDLTGLPPTIAEVEAFLNDHRPGAYQRVVDRLLSSPHYGERWARIWMDLCHYGDTDGYLTDQLRPFAWRYRDWLIAALNRDVPFDQFTVEQLAGDLLPHASLDQRIATGLLRQTLSNREGGADLEEFRVMQVVDRTEMVGAIWLGTTIGCARCHDHFYDPIAQREFFQLYACFDNADEVNINAPLPGQAEPYAKAYVGYLQEREKAIAPIREPLNSLRKRWEARLLQAYRKPGEDAHWDRQWELLGLVWGGNLGEGQLEGVEIVKLPWQQRTRQQQDDLLDYFLRTSGDIDPDEYKRLDLAELRSILAALKDALPPMARAPTMRAAQTRRITHVHQRGGFRQPGEQVVGGVPRALAADRKPLQLYDSTAPINHERLELARWLVSTQNPLTARVTVNRMWQDFFGYGLVRTPEDFGARGEPPTHPELLDYLASEFMRRQWSVKAMHRMIVLSATYRQSSLPREDLAQVDPTNRLLARQNSLRLPAEMIRDSALQASGSLCRRFGGPGIKPPQPVRVIMEAFDNKTWQPSDGGDRYRRSVYIYTIRTAPYAQSAIFDAPNPNQICPRRDRSNTPLQALTLLNDAVFMDAARHLSSHILQSFDNDRERIRYAVRQCLLRDPNKQEQRVLQEFLDKQSSEFRKNPQSAWELITGKPAHEETVPDDDQHMQNAAWINVCSVLLNLHEFIVRD